MDSRLVTYSSTISVLHQVVQALRSGVVGQRFEKVEYVGHSFGSMYGLGEASTYQDVDALLLTGSAHQVSPAFGALVASAYVPAAGLALRFAGLDSGWLASRPGTVGQLHYWLPGADPRVIAADEASAEVVSAAEFATRPPDTSALMAGIRVPVLLLDGDHDIHYCAPDAVDCSSERSFHDSEAVRFASSPCVTTELADRTGHNVMLHATARRSAAAMLAWSWWVLPAQGGWSGCPRDVPAVAAAGGEVR
ncbi:hypothetical protein GCM10029964_093330 [Kibdelosporangium lantanae]